MSSPYFFFPQGAASSTRFCTARYSQSSGQSISNGTTPIIINFATQWYDANAAVTTGSTWMFTAPFDGVLSIATAIRFTSATFTSSVAAPSLYFFKNGVNYSFAASSVEVTRQAFWPLSMVDSMEVTAGDLVDVRVAHGESAARALQGATLANYISLSLVES